MLESIKNNCEKSEHSLESFFESSKIKIIITKMNKLLFVKASENISLGVALIFNKEKNNLYTYIVQNN